MKTNISMARRVFLLFNYIILIGFALLCFLPIVHVFSVSFSSTSMADGGLVGLWPRDFSVSSYKYVFLNADFFRSLWISVERVFLGVIVNMFLTILTAYPLARYHGEFRYRTLYCWFFVITMLFNGGIIPLYMLVSALHLKDSVLALVLPSAVPVFNVILLINFFRQIPKDYSDATSIDGGGHWTILWKMYAPMSTPSIATLTLFCIVSHWNSWFDGMLYMNSMKHYPLQTYLQTVVISVVDIASAGNLDNMKDMANISNKTVRAARIFLGALPVMLIYLPLQKYFVQGITLGGIKG